MLQWRAFSWEEGKKLDFEIFNIMLVSIRFELFFVVMTCSLQIVKYVYYLISWVNVLL